MKRWKMKKNNVAMSVTNKCAEPFKQNHTVHAGSNPEGLHELAPSHKKIREEPFANSNNVVNDMGKIAKKVTLSENKRESENKSEVTSEYKNVKENEKNSVAISEHEKKKENEKKTV